MMISIPLISDFESACSYKADQQSRSLFVARDFELSVPIYSALIQQGFRRSGSEVYRPSCSKCNACIPSRIRISDFKTNRNQKRCLKKNLSTRTQIRDAKFSQKQYDLFIRYQKYKHKDGHMASLSTQEYLAFLSSPWCQTLFIEFYIQQQLAAVTIVDVLENALSAVYTFFDPLFSDYSLGTYAVLSQIEMAEKSGLEFVYLGYWIKNCSKMAYKNRFRPLEGWIDNVWQGISQDYNPEISSEQPPI